jgi:hypothetical protein
MRTATSMRCLTKSTNASESSRQIFTPGWLARKLRTTGRSLSRPNAPEAYLAEQVGGDLGIVGCRAQFPMTKQHLDDPDVDSVLRQVGGKAVAPMPISA